MTETEKNTNTEEQGEVSHIFEDVVPENTAVSPIPILPELGVSLGLLVLVFSITYIGASSQNHSTPEHTDDMQIVTQVVDSSVPVAQTNTAFNETKIEADSAFVWDVANQKILFNKNGDDVRPLASVTKLMTALVAYELLDPKDRVTISMRSLKAEGDSGLSDGESFSMQDLADLTLISSSNDGATALSARAGNIIVDGDNPEGVFVTAMNIKAEELGLTKTYFENSTGLDISTEKAGAYGSARDMAFLMEHIISHVPNAVALTALDITRINNLNGEYHTAKNTNEIVDDIDGLIASKTGYTELAGGNLVIAFNAGLNRPIIIVVLGSSYEGRFTDMQSLIEEARVAVH